MTLIFRAATAQDADDITAMAPKDIADYGAWLIGNCQVSMLHLGETLVGFFALRGDTVQAMFVAPGFRNQGIGAKVLNHLKSTLTTITLWVLDANSAALRFYAAHGFQVIGQSRDNEAQALDKTLRWRR